MKQCPKCNSTYANDKQKFCTKDGTALVDAHEARAGQDETIRIDSAQLDDEITKVISQPLPQMIGSSFDPYKTQVSTPQEKTPTPAVSQPSAPPPAAEPAPPPPAPPPTVSAPSPEPIVPPPSQTVAPPPSQPVGPPPTIAATLPPPAAPATANIAAQSTNASISPDTTPSAIPPAPQIAPAPAAAAAPPTAITPPRKRSKLPLILGILFVLLFLAAGGVVAGYFFVLRPMLDKNRVVTLEPRRPEPTPRVASAPDIGNHKPEAPKTEVPPYSPPDDAVQFVNSSAKLDGRLAEHYVDFSFYYPKHWQKDPKAGVSGASNFARVERRLPPDFTQENFAVGWYSSAGSDEGDLAAFHNLAETLSAQYARNPDFVDYQKTSEGPTTVGSYKGYEFRFETASHNRKDIKIWGRVIFLPPVDGGKNGVTLLMFATSLASEIRSVDDVGVKGELPMMLESFRFGK